MKTKLIQHIIKIRYVNRILEILIKAIKEYPDKIRLWAKTIEFVHEAGINNGCYKIYFLIDELRRDRIINSLSSKFLKGFVIQVFTEMIFRSIRRISDLEISSHKRNNSIAFLESALNGRMINSVKTFSRRNKMEFIIIKVNLFYFAFSTLKLLSKELVRDLPIIHKQLVPCPEKTAIDIGNIML